MITELLQEILPALKSWKACQTLLERLDKGPWPVEVEGAQGSFTSLLLYHVLKNRQSNSLIVVPSDAEAEDLAEDLSILGLDAEVFPSWGTLIYQGVSPQARVFGQRSRALARLRAGRAIVVASIKALASPVPSPEAAAAGQLRLTKGNQINPARIAGQLTALGYLRVPRVTVPGEFALRGEVLDLYLQGESQALRAVFEYDTIEELKRFDPLTQASTGREKEVLVYPARELAWTPEARARLAAAAQGDPWEGASRALSAFEAELEAGASPRGEELFFPLGLETRAGLWDHLGPQALVLAPDWERSLETARAWPEELAELYRRSRGQGLNYPPPELITHDPVGGLDTVARRLRFVHLRGEGTQNRIKLAVDGPRSFLGNLNFFKEELTRALEAGYRVYLWAESPNQAQRLEFLVNNPAVKVSAQGLGEGFGLPEQKILVVHEQEVFGRRRRAPVSLQKVESQAIDSFVDLGPGDFVVHLNYGVGRFLGIERVRAGGQERDYIALEYAGSEKVFVPIEQVNLVQRYIGNEGRDPKLDSLGGKSWDTKKARARKSVEDLADRLVALYARRREAVGYAFPADNEWQMSFEAGFPYQETDDQIRAIEEVKADMESARPMDRLVCGDVGYGKTEVAMRAAFKAVMGGRQVAFLAPTTILAEQHYENFVERFKRFPVRLGMLSRFVEPKKQKQQLEALARGEIELIIGTHRLLQKDVVFKNLGLLIVDEEQRFGVKDKERLKEMRASIDCLTLSATPIPRTLHMSLLKIRDMSVLRTAPRNRHPIETFVQEFREETIAGAIRREVERGGQVFYLHNRVETLEDVQIFLRKIVPEVLVETAHGQMGAKDLEDVMHRFIHGGFHVLVSTTIIENGIDIPNVNTIIIDRADMYGISQLYQLRGRVGRSGKLAYAYLFYPQERALTELAMKRLQIISDFTELGSGFKIAMKDLEVRGAGNLLGAEQSGDILAVGFDLYLKLLDEAVAAKEGKARDDENEVLLELDYTGFIPDGYIADASEKMEVYKRIAGVTDDVELDRVYQEIGDRYGPMPEEVLSLLSLAEIRIICRKLKILSLRERGGFCTVEFGRMKDFPFEKAMRLLRDSQGRVKSLPTKPNVLVLETRAVGLKEKSLFIRERLSSLL